MTIQEFHNNFDIEFDKTQDFEYPYILAEQKDYWLNKAQDRFIDERAYPLDKNKTGFEQDQKRVDDLRNVVTSSSLSLNPISTGYRAGLPNNYWHLIRHKCTTLSPCGSKTVGGEQTTHEYINQMLKDPFWEPTSEQPLYYFMGNEIIYETKGNFTITNVTIDYIKTPNRIQYGSAYQAPTGDIPCELNPKTHHKILDMAISMMLENTESVRYQTNLNELNKTE